MMLLEMCEVLFRMFELSQVQLVEYVISIEHSTCLWIPYIPKWIIFWFNVLHYNNPLIIVIKMVNTLKNNFFHCPILFCQRSVLIQIFILIFGTFISANLKNSISNKILLNLLEIKIFKNRESRNFLK